MKYNNLVINDMSLEELQSADWDLGVKEATFTASLDNAISLNPKKFEKINPKPELGLAFKKLREEIKQAIKLKEQ
jgi:hypothetical protein